MSAGQLREVIALLAPAAPVADGRGGWRPGGPDAETPLYARVRELGKGEKFFLGEVLNDTAHEITIRYRPGVAPTQRVRWRGRLLNIQNVATDERRAFITLTCFNSGQ